MWPPTRFEKSGRKARMTPTKLLIGQILFVLAIVLAGMWFATQWAASALTYQPQRGPAWLFVFGMPVYRPWSIFPWWYHFEAYGAEHVAEYLLF
jgi:type IV secretion system protein VirD4